jgi:hypothetical protein
MCQQVGHRMTLDLQSAKSLGSLTSMIDINGGEPWMIDNPQIAELYTLGRQVSVLKDTLREQVYKCRENLAISLREVGRQQDYFDLVIGHISI